MTDYNSARRGLIYGAILVMLHGKRAEIVTGLRTRASCTGDTQLDYSKHHLYLDVKRCEEGFRSTHILRTANVEIVDLLAHTQQTLKISNEEWESLVKVNVLSSYAERC